MASRQGVVQSTGTNIYTTVTRHIQHQLLFHKNSKSICSSANNMEKTTGKNLHASCVPTRTGVNWRFITWYGYKRPIQGTKFHHNNTICEAVVPRKYSLDKWNNHTILDFDDRILWKPAIWRKLKYDKRWMRVAWYLVHHAIDIRTFVSIYQTLTWQWKFKYFILTINRYSAYSGDFTAFHCCHRNYTTASLQSQYLYSAPHDSDPCVWDVHRNKTENLCQLLHTDTTTGKSTPLLDSACVHLEICAHAGRNNPSAHYNKKPHMQNCMLVTKLSGSSVTKDYKLIIHSYAGRRI